MFNSKMYKKYYPIKSSFDIGIMVVNAMMLCYMAIGISIFMAHKKEKKNRQEREKRMINEKNLKKNCRKKLRQSEREKSQ